MEGSSSATLAQGRGRQREAHGGRGGAGEAWCGATDSIWLFGFRSGSQGGRELRCIGRKSCTCLVGADDDVAI
jgi:hypothetical protein